MKDLTATSGSLMFTIIHGGPITTEDGLGTLSAVGRGALMSRGDGVYPITADGTGGLAWVGTGFRPGDGDLPGCTGITGPIISAGVR